METPDFSLDGPPIVAGVADPQARVVQGREIPVWQIDEGTRPGFCLETPICTPSRVYCISDFHACAENLQLLNSI